MSPDSEKNLIEEVSHKLSEASKYIPVALATVGLVYINYILLVVGFESAQQKETVWQSICFCLAPFLFTEIGVVTIMLLSRRKRTSGWPQIEYFPPRTPPGKPEFPLWVIDLNNRLKKERQVIDQPE